MTSSGTRGVSGCGKMSRSSRSNTRSPAGTPAAIVDKLHAEVAKILADPGIKSKADASGLFPATSTPEEFSAFIRKEAERWSTVVKDSGMKYD